MPISKFSAHLDRESKVFGNSSPHLSIYFVLRTLGNVLIFFVVLIFDGPIFLKSENIWILNYRINVDLIEKKRVGIEQLSS